MLIMLVVEEYKDEYQKQDFARRLDVLNKYNK